MDTLSVHIFTYVYTYRYTYNIHIHIYLLTVVGLSGLKLLVYEALSYQCSGLKLLVYEALSIYLLTFVGLSSLCIRSVCLEGARAASTCAPNYSVSADLRTHS